MTLEIHDAILYPLCQKDNEYGMTNNSSAGASWCFEEAFLKEIFNQLQIDRERVCICQNCSKVFSFHNNILA